MKCGLPGLLFALALPAMAGELTQCAGIQSDPVRLACYDKLAKSALANSDSVIVANADTAADKAHTANALKTGKLEVTLPPSPVTALSERWELDPQSKTGTFKFRAHESTYILPVYGTNSVNRLPSSPSTGHGVSSAQNRQANEVKYQLSFKTKLAEDLFDGRSDLWFGYTQQSHWQLYNSDGSRPFRETNYMPEVILTTRTDFDVLGWHGRFVNLGLLHQSNGQALPLSRSWNRVYAQAGLERGNFALLVRPWWRIPERSQNDDNPDITKYMGHGDVTALWKNDGHVISVTARQSFSADGKGALQGDWAFPIARNLKGHIQMFTGYGESLIDYNYRQTTIGFGVSLSEGL